jgi:hypothetical protein
MSYNANWNMDKMPVDLVDKNEEQVITGITLLNDGTKTDVEYTLGPSTEIQYVFNEKKVLADVLAYIDTTYSGHYSAKKSKKGSKKKIQVTEFACSHCDSPQDALRFNVLKYAARYGHKKGFNKDDLLKSIHYLVMMIDYHDKFLAEADANGC